MADRQSIDNPHSHYGSPKAATRHFITQRLTGALNIVFMLFFIWLVVSIARGDRTHLMATLGNPLVALVTALLVISITVHMRIGMREIIEDYVHAPANNRLALTANTLFAVIIAAVGLIALVKIVFWG